MNMKKMFNIFNKDTGEKDGKIIISSSPTAALRRVHLSAKSYKAIEIEPKPIAYYSSDNPYRLRCVFDIQYDIEDYILIATMNYDKNIYNPSWCKIRHDRFGLFVYYEREKLGLDSFIRICAF